jgi:hypothetical protein
MRSASIINAGGAMRSQSPSNAILGAKKGLLKRTRLPCFSCSTEMLSSVQWRFSARRSAKVSLRHVLWLGDVPALRDMPPVKRCLVRDDELAALTGRDRVYRYPCCIRLIAGPAQLTGVILEAYCGQGSTKMDESRYYLVGGARL